MNNIHELLVWLDKKINWKWFVVFVITMLVINSNIRNSIKPKEVDGGNFPLQQKWSAKMSDKVHAFSTSENGVIFAQSPYSLNALDASNGELLWKFLTEGGTSSSPALNGIVYVRDKKFIYALMEIDGEQIWKHSLKGLGAGRIIGISDRIVLLHTVGGILSAYSIQDGSPLWETSTQHSTGYAAFIDKNNNIVYNFPYSGIQALDALTGKELWKINDNYGNGFFNSSVIYRTYETGLNAFDVQSQSNLWEKRMDIFNPDTAKYILFKENIIIANSESIFAIQKTTGVVKWQIYYDFETQNSPTIIGNQLFIMEGFSRAIRVYDADTGNEIGALRISLPAFAAIEHNEMTTINNMLIFANGKIVYAYSK